MPGDSDPTTITVPTYVRRMLDGYKRPGMSYADVLLAFIEEHPTQEFLREMERREREEPRISLQEFRRRHGF